SRIPVNGFIILPFSGTYSILATSFAPEARGAYTLTLTAGANCSLTPIAFGETRQGTLSAGDCTNAIDLDGTLVDLYTFNGTAGQQVSITMTATAPGNVDPYLYLLLPNGDLSAENDNGGGGTAARIPPNGGFGRLPITGTYTIVANTLATNQSGNYSLTLTKAATDCASVPLTPGTTVNGTLANGDCRLLEDGSFLDAYTFNGAANAQITLTMTSSTAGLSPVVFLLSPTGYVLAIGTPPTGGSPARIPDTGSFTLPTTGTYTVLANSSVAGQTGDYTLALTGGVQQNTHTISGQIRSGVDQSSVGLSGITVILSGGASATTTTDGSGHYSFAGLPAGNNYTITPTNTAQHSFTPQTVIALQADQMVNFIGIPHVIISEFRFRGTAGATDEFVELYNQTDQTRDITGWSLVSGNTVLHTVSSGSIPARSHYLVTGANYSLPAASDGALNVDIPDSAAVALFTNAPTFTSGSRIDAAGFSTAVTLYTEGGGLSPASGITTDSEHAFVRKLTSGTPQDTDNNSTDFVLVATDPLVVGNNAVLGAPGAENRTSPIQRNATIKGSLIDPQCAGFGAATSGCARVRTAAGANPTTAQYGTLRIRRKFTNTIGANVTTLRFRVVGITTQGSPGAGSGQADLRVLSSSPADFNVTLTNGAIVPVKGTQVETPPAQPNGGGLNSTVITITTATPVLPNNSVNVEFTLGVQQEGAFSFFVNVEALTALEATKAGVMKRAGSRKAK
ncbi:MAG TPA: lamin tail domain-containing protein, partial [Pyrinomonadaceae bacterium]